MSYRLLSTNIFILLYRMLNNGNPHRDKHEIFTNKSNSFKKEKESSSKNEPEKTDFSEEAYNSYSKDTAIGCTPKYKSDIKNLDIHKNKESLENQCEINKNEKWWVFYCIKI